MQRSQKDLCSGKSLEAEWVKCFPTQVLLRKGWLYLPGVGGDLCQACATSLHLSPLAGKEDLVGFCRECGEVPPLLVSRDAGEVGGL